MQGALGAAQMDRPTTILDDRRQRAPRYDELLRDFGGCSPRSPRPARARLPGVRLPVPPGGADDRQRPRAAPSSATRSWPSSRSAGIATRQGTHCAVLTGLYARQVRPQARGLPAQRARRPADARTAALSADDRRRAGDRRAASCDAAFRAASRSAMCGIAGALSLNGGPVADERSCAAMTRAIAHRGPDDEGSLVDGAGRARQPPARDHRPLAGRAQPMTDATGRPRHHLQRRALQLPRAAAPSSSGPATASARTPTPRSCCTPTASGASRASTGSTACSAWRSGTRRRRELFLARDRYGVKPRLLHRGRRRLLFGSEIKSFLEHPAFRVDVSLPHLLEYFTFQNVFSDGTLFAGVKLLPPGCYLTAEPRRAGSRADPLLGLPLHGGRRLDLRRRSTWRSSTGSSARRSSASSSATSPWAPTSPAAWTRGRSPRSRRARSPTSRRSPAGST